MWRITLDRTDARNAVSREMLARLTSGLAEAAADEGCRVVLLTGEGEHFCAGADFGEIEGDPAAFERDFAAALDAIASHPVPVVAAIRGAALGAGCQIAVACDLAVSAADARIGIPSSRLGIVIGFENIQRLVLAIGPKRASELLFTGTPVDGVTAAAWGLVNEAVDASEVAARAEAVAAEIASGAPLSVRGSKRGIAAVLAHLSVGAEPGLAEVDAAVAEAFASEDLREGVRAFRERRPPKFEGR